MSTPHARRPFRAVSSWPSPTPKAFAAIGAVYSGNVLVGSDLLADGLLKIAILSVTVVLINSAWLIFGTMISALLRDPYWARAINVVFALLLLVSVALAVF